MSDGVYKKLSATKAADLCGHFELPEEARGWLDGRTTGQFLDLLVEKEQLVAAIDLLAHALPKREAVWWGCLCLREVHGPDFAPKDQAALKAAAQWVLDPSEEKRQAAAAPAEATEYATPAGCLALAAFGSGGSLNPPNLPAVPPDPYLTAKTVSGSLLMAATKGDPLQVPEMQRRFVELGQRIAQGKVDCPQAKKKP